MPETIRLQRARPVRATTSIRRSLPARVALRRNSRTRARSQTYRASRRARGRAQQRQRQNRHHKSRPHCAARSHQRNYNTVPHPPETTNRPECRYLHSGSLQPRTLACQLTLAFNPCIMFAWNVAKFHRSRLAQPDCFFRTTPGRKSPAYSRGYNSIKLRRLHSSLEFAHTHAACSATGSLVPEFK